jgi:hypothetical protein
VPKYTIEYDTSAGPDDALAGRAWDVVYTQAWDNGRYLPPIAQRCTKDDADRIVRGLEALERLPALEAELLDLRVSYNATLDFTRLL